MIHLNISDNEGFILDYGDEIHKFYECTLTFKNKSEEICLTEDDLYYIVEGMLYRLQNIPLLEHEKEFGRIGKWQEYYLFSRPEINWHSEEVKHMEESLFKSGVNHGSFMYKYDGKVWLEFNKGYSEECGMSPLKYYSDPVNYRVLLTSISDEILAEWEKKLKEIKDIYDKKWAEEMEKRT